MKPLCAGRQKGVSTLLAILNTAGKKDLLILIMLFMLLIEQTSF